MRLRWLSIPVLSSALVCACSADPGPSGGDEEDDDVSSGGSGGASSQTNNGGATTFNPTTTGNGGTGAGTNNCGTDPNVDDDQDSFTEMQGDCNDCDANVNPGAVEVIVVDGGGGAGGGGMPMEPADEDCDGMVDNPITDCDVGLTYNDADPMSGAKAIDLCKVAAQSSWGVVNAAWVRADGTATVANPQVGILEGFGPNVNVQAGERLLAISSGHARLPTHPDACNSSTCLFGPGVPPPGFPAMVPGCSGGSNINDDAALEVTIKAPTNATGYSFLFKFHSFEFPEWVCTAFNDQFIALVTPPPMGAINGNISFDSMNNPVSVNIAFFDVCDPNGIANYASLCGNCKQPPNPYCPSGTAELQGTGFDTWSDAGGTSWLKTTAPINPGEQFSIRFAIWDVADQALDSTALVDAFEWVANGGTPGIGTEPIPDPK